jgi:Fe-S oxidoreductase
MDNGAVSPDDYDVMLVNRDWNFFSIYRDTYAVHYDGLAGDKFDTLFFPGCTLAAYAPELTRAAYAWLQQHGLAVGFSDMCCGKPLDSIGLPDQASRYLQRLRRIMEDAGARRIVTACSNCEAHLKEHLPDFEIHSIYGLMRREGVHLAGPETLTFHDSCPDRCNPRNPADVRALLGGYPQVEMASHGQNTICCGSGGIVSMIDPELCASRSQQRLDEFAASGAEVCVTSCMACAHRLARSSAIGQVRHCLEVLLGVRVDYAQVEANTRQMWEAGQGELNVQRLAHARNLDPKELK